jgi:hypothetical protein
MKCHYCGGWRRNPDYEKALAIIDNPEVDKHLNTPVVRTLLQLFNVHIQGPPRLGNYYSPYHFVLQHGQYFKDCVPDPKLGPKQLCFFNSQKIAVEDPDLLYAEGFVYTMGQPIAHGWNVMRDGTVLDTTLRGRGAECKEYFGIVFKTEFVLTQMIFHEAYQALIDNWKADFPLIRNEELQKEAFR